MLVVLLQTTSLYLGIKTWHRGFDRLSLETFFYFVFTFNSFIFIYAVVNLGVVPSALGGVFLGVGLLTALYPPIVVGSLLALKDEQFRNRRVTRSFYKERRQLIPS